MQFSATIETAVFKIIRSVSEPNWLNPSSSIKSEWRTGSAFAINISDRNFIITNAHCVGGNGIVQLLRRGTSNLYKAKIIAALEECDLALLEPMDASFWNGIQPLYMMKSIPNKGGRVYVMGYPLGGYNISVTEGVVSRIATYEYSSVTKGISLQVDAIINAGNSGGPVLDSAGSVVGVVVAKEQEEYGISGVGYVIPMFFIDYLLESILRKEFTYINPKNSPAFSGFNGIVSMPIDIQALHNERIREYFGIPETETGVLITSSDITSVKTFDVLTHINGAKLYNDGTMNLSDLTNDLGYGPNENGEVVSFKFLISLKHIGDKVDLTLLRSGKRIVAEYIISPTHTPFPILANHLPKPNKPDWVFIMGMIFTQKTQMLIDQAALEHISYTNLPGDVVLSHVYDTDYTEDFTEPIGVLHAVNGIIVKSIPHLITLVYGVPEPKKKSNTLLFEFKNSNAVCVLHKDDIKNANAKMAEEIGLTKLFDVYIPLSKSKPSK